MGGAGEAGAKAPVTDSACACVCVCARAWLLSEARVGPQADQVALTSMMPVG